MPIGRSVWPRNAIENGDGVPHVVVHSKDDMRLTFAYVRDWLDEERAVSWWRCEGCSGTVCGRSGAAESTKRLERRAERCGPIVTRFFTWLRQTVDERALLPSNPFTEAARYALAREASLRVFLEYVDVPIDTNHLEREIRPIALGRKNWMFCWTELGAEQVGIFQSLLATCRLQGLDPYTYLVDVLQRVAEHPARDVTALIPRLWKDRFADDPMRSDIDRRVNNVVV